MTRLTCIYLSLELGLQTVIWAGKVYSLQSSNYPQLSIRDQTEPLWLLAGLSIPRHGYCLTHTELAGLDTGHLRTQRRGTNLNDCRSCQLWFLSIWSSQSMAGLGHGSGCDAEISWAGRQERDGTVVVVIPHYHCSARCSHNRHQERAGAGLTCRVTFLPYNPSYTIHVLLYTYYYTPYYR